jgi:hypothetical protein
MLGFLKAKKRDEEKTEWCYLNGIKQIILPFNEDVPQWQERLNNEKQF